MANFDEIFTDDNKPKSNWFKFQNIGDRIAGTLVSFKDQAGQGDFQAQRIFTLRDREGTVWNVGIALNRDVVLARAATARIGDILGFKFEKEIPPTKKGRKPAKSIDVFVKAVEAPVPANDEPFDN